MVKKLIAFSYYGGKFSHLNWLLPLLPDDCQTFVDVFGGSGAVILNRKPSPVDVYNDIDGEVVNFFRVLRESPEELIGHLSLTPYARDEFVDALQRLDTDSDIEKARKFFVRIMQSVSSQSGTKTQGNWSYAVTVSRRSMPMNVSKYLSKVEGMMELVSRLRTMEIDNKPATDIIQRYDSPNTLFYCDPPYMSESRVSGNVYQFDTSDDLQGDLAACLNSVKGRVALSGYRGPLMDAMYGRWYRFDANPKITTGAVAEVGEKRSMRQESLWTNYPLPKQEVTQN